MEQQRCKSNGHRIEGEVAQIGRDLYCQTHARLVMRRTSKFVNNEPVQPMSFGTKFVIGVVVVVALLIVGAALLR